MQNEFSNLKSETFFYSLGTCSMKVQKKTLSHPENTKQ